MNECDACIVIGYSFRDTSINEKLERLVAQEKKLIIVDKLGEHNVRTNFLPASFEPSSDKDHSISVNIDGNTKDICIIPDYMDVANIDDILRRVSKFMQ